MDESIGGVIVTLSTPSAGVAAIEVGANGKTPGVFVIVVLVVL
jgi:hypothetical protein